MVRRIVFAIGYVVVGVLAVFSAVMPVTHDATEAEKRRKRHALLRARLRRAKFKIVRD